MKRLVIHLCLFVFVVAAVTAQDWQSVVKKYGPAVGKVETRDGGDVLSTGSCFLIDENGRILTNAHVVKDASFNPDRKIVVTFPFGAQPAREYPATIVKIATQNDHDLALLKVDGHFDAFCALATGEEPALMSEVLVVGFPLGKNFKSTPGYLQAYQEIEGIGHMLDLSASVDFGNSGGPVFDKNGTVVGIVTARLPGFNFNLALPIRDAADFISADDRQFSVKVTTTPDGARVFLNGNYQGVSPLTADLFHRDYVLHVEKDGYVTVEKTVSLTGNAKPEISVALSLAVDTTAVKLSIATTPAGVQVLIDNTDRGVTPLTLDATKGSRIRIKLRLRGYKDFYTEVTLGDANEQGLAYTLEKTGFLW
jgi:S1-C subfamily serine protease